MKIVKSEYVCVFISLYNRQISHAHSHTVHDNQHCSSENIVRWFLANWKAPIPVTYRYLVVLQVQSVFL